MNDSSRPRRLDWVAVVSLVTAILGLVCFLPVIGSLAGIVLGTISRDRIERDPTLGGKGLAQAGRIVGFVGFGTLLLGGALLALLVPALGKARDQAYSARDANNLKMIGLATAMYADDFNDHLPPDLAAVAPYLGGDYGVLVNPRSGTAEPTNEFEVRDGRTDYVYRGKVLPLSRLQRPQATVVAHSRPGVLPDDRVNILFADGHVEMRTAPNGVDALVDEAGLVCADNPAAVGESGD